MANITTALPDLNNFKVIADQQVTAFRNDGHTLIKGLLDPSEVEIYREHIVKAAEKSNTEKRKIEERDTYGKAFLQIMNLWRSDESVKQFVLAKRFAKVAADLLGVDNVRIYHDQALFERAWGWPHPLASRPISLADRYPKYGYHVDAAHRY